jgi:DNA gyrase subunit A
VFLFLGTLRGVVKKVATSEFVNAKTRGIIAINLDEGDKLVAAVKTSGKDEVVLVTRRGQALRIEESDVRVMGRGSRGVCGIKLSDADELTAMLRVSLDEAMLLISEHGYGKRTDFDNYAKHGRATRGQRIYEPDEKSGEIIGAITLKEQDEVVVITSQGKTLKLSAADVRLCGKTARGVRIVNIDLPAFVVGIDRIVNEAIDPALIASAAESSEAGDTTVIGSDDQASVQQDGDALESNGGD